MVLVNGNDGELYQFLGQLSEPADLARNILYWLLNKPAALIEKWVTFHFGYLKLDRLL